MSTSTQPTTADQLLRMPDDGFRYELVEGELRKMSPAGSEHGMLVVNVTLRLSQHVVKAALGVVFGAETGFLLSENPDTVRAPDVAFVRKERIPDTGVPASFWPGAPDLAVEVVSPSDRFGDVEEKVQGWLSAGTRAVWVVNPRGRSVTVYGSTTDIIRLTEDDVLEGGDVVPGFSCPVGEIFGVPREP
jgi:Uma2 family endonuclease